MNDLDFLLDKYFSGATSQEEEKRLRDYFMLGPVADVHEQYIPLFGYISEAQHHAPVWEGLLPTKQRSRKWLYVGSAAAVALLFFSLYHFINVETPVVEQKSFVIIDGFYSDDPKQLHYYAAQAIDRFFEAEQAGFEDNQKAINQAFKAISDCLAPFDAIYQF